MHHHFISFLRGLLSNRKNRAGHHPTPLSFSKRGIGAGGTEVKSSARGRSSGFGGHHVGSEVTARRAEFAYLLVLIARRDTIRERAAQSLHEQDWGLLGFKSWALADS